MGVGRLGAGPAVALGAGLLAFTLYFFRDPERTPPPNADRLRLAPADGRVVEVVDEHDPIYLDGPAQRVSIFLSLLDVHVNRVPCAGTVEHVRYRPGDYLVAWHPKASEKSERSEIGIRHPSGTRVLFEQIAGAVARRIEYHLAEGDTVQAGERFGIVKFGSRMDVVVPLDVALDIAEGDVVRAGESVLGRLPVPDPDAPATRALRDDRCPRDVLFVPILWVLMANASSESTTNGSSASGSSPVESVSRSRPKRIRRRLSAYRDALSDEHFQRPFEMKDLYLSR